MLLILNRNVARCGSCEPRTIPSRRFSWHKIVSIEVLQVDLEPKVKRSDAIQSFERQETPMVRITDSDGFTGTGYSYTILHRRVVGHQVS